MRTTYILICLAVALAIIATGGLAFRAASRGAGDAARAQRACAWFATLFGFALVGAIAVAHLTGRFAAILLAGAVTWLRRPAPAAVRFGLPAVVLVLAGGAALILRLTGNSAPIAMSMPTMSQAAPALSYFDTDGKLHALADFKGKVVLLNFWATWCTPCRREMPLLSKLQGEHANDGLVVLYLSLEEPGVLTEFLRKNRFDGVHGRLADAAPFYNAGKFYPLSYLISREGRVEKRWSGRPTEQWIDSAIREELKPAG